MIGFCRDAVRVLKMRCIEHTALMSRAAESPLTRGERAGLRLHTAYCTGCRRFEKQLKLIRQLAASLGHESDAGEAMPADAQARVARALAEPDRSRDLH